MNRTTARVTVAVAGFGALTGLAVGAAHADESDYGSAAPSTTQADDEAAGQASGQGPGTDGATAGPDGLAPNHVLHGAPGLPIGDPVSNVFDVAAPAYGVLGALG